MKTRITIEVDFENGNNPVIQILHKHSDDVRDGLVSSFLQSLAHTSRWATLKYKEPRHFPNNETFDVWRIEPITPRQLEKEMKLMRALLDSMSDSAPQG